MGLDGGGRGRMWHTVRGRRRLTFCLVDLERGLRIVWGGWLGGVQRCLDVRC